MKKILIVEDDQIVANIYRNKFTVEGFQVEVALDGATGLELVRSFRPDAVILDLVLPKMSGVELMKSIRAEPDCQHLPVIVFSNTYLSNMVQEAWKAGATKCLSKANCTPKQVIEVVRSVCGNGAPVQGGTAFIIAPPAGTTPSGAAASAWRQPRLPAATDRHPYLLGSGRRISGRSSQGLYRGAAGQRRRPAHDSPSACEMR